MKQTNTQGKLKKEGVMKPLEGKKIAILAENFYEDLELWFPLLRFRGLGAEVVVVGSGSSDTYAGKHGYPVTVDKSLAAMPRTTCGATPK
jgi:putative intracellular protease/amidase